jgi:hypothetical protein
MGVLCLSRYKKLLLPLMPYNKHKAHIRSLLPLIATCANVLIEVCQSTTSKLLPG